jgi:amino acid adenylation domain-containing protein
MSFNPLSLIHIFEQSVVLFPESIAIKGENFCYTYREFDLLTNKFAVELIQEGIGKGSVAGICMDRSAEMLIGIMGILRTGAAYLPLDPGNPVKRNKSLIRDSNVQLIVTTPEYTELIDSFECKYLIPSSDIYSPVNTEILSYPEAHDIAYILFTSGSTGIPKGVMIEHHSVVNLISFIQKRYPLSPGDVVLFKSPYTFDGSIWELFGWMLMGGTLYVAPTGVEKDPRKLLQIIKQEKIAFLFFVPSMLQAFLNFFPGKLNPEDTQSLHWISVGGEVLPVNLVKNFYNKTGNNNVGLINVYGPTETTVYATTFLCRFDENYSRIPIGDAVENDFIYILNEDGKEVPDGEEGEIFIGGEGVARGYLNNPGLTDERFLPDPFTGKGLMYKTGDTGKKNADGTYDFTGRKDFQVKLRGQRIECGEIEHALLQTGFISECVVQVDKDHSGDDCLVAWIISEDSSSLPQESQFLSANPELILQIKTAISEWLPGFMIPTYFIVCKAFALTSHGKTNRKLFPALTDILPNDNNLVVLPETDAERLINELWIRVLGRKNISIDDDFFEAGGHSLKAVQLISWLMKESGVEIPLSAFYKGITIREMAKGIVQGEYLVVQPTEIFQSEIDPEEGLPITPVQQELWVMNNFDVTGLTHNIQIAFTVKGKVSVNKLNDAFIQTIQKESVFRSVFKSVDGIPFQFIQSDVNVTIQFTSLIEFSSVEKNEKYRQICDTNGKALFSTDKLPLFSLHLVRMDEDEYRMLMTVHHLIFDGWSLSLFMEKILNHYRGIPVDNPGYTNADYVRFLHTSFNAGKAEKELQYWKNKLRNLPERWNLPHKLNANTAESGKYGDRYWWRTDKLLTADIENFALENRTTPFVVFMTAFQLSLASAGGNRDVIVGTPFANRNNEIVNYLIGYYTNMVSIRLSWDEQANLQNLIIQCSTNALEAFSNALVPFGEVAKSVGNKGTLSTNPVFQAIFVMQNWPHESSRDLDFSFHQQEIGNKTAKTDLMFNVEFVDGEYVCWLEYDTMLFDEGIVRNLAEAINVSLRTLTQNSQMQIDVLISRLRKILLPEKQNSCYIAGEGKLAAQCAIILREKGFYIESVISDDAWLKKQLQVPFITTDQFNSAGNTWEEVDYIFSINNSIILKQDFLSSARKKAFNYHDSPLPVYAGMYATNHAILENQSFHGVSWHEITDQIDAGDIFSSESVVIHPEDTVLTLNTSCFEASLKCFERLTQDILSDNLKPVQQDLSKRTYYPLAKRPDFFGTLRPSMTFQQADSLIKATDFGSSYNNEFALPWIVINHEYYIVGSAEVYAIYQGKPGFFDIRDENPGFYCRDGFISLNALYNHSGEIVLVADVFSKADRMNEPDYDFCSRAAESFKKIAVFEPLLVREMRNVNYISWPYQTFESQFAKTIIRELNTEEVLKNFRITERKTDFLIAVCSLLLLRLSGEDFGSFAFIPEKSHTLIPEFFSERLPFNAGPSNRETGEEAIHAIVKKIKMLRKVQFFVHSLPVRYPDLKKNIDSKPKICFIEGNDISRCQPGMVNIFVSETGLIIAGEQQFVESFDDFLRCVTLYIRELVENPAIKHECINIVVNASVDVSVAENAVEENPDVMKRFYQMVDIHPDRIAIVDQKIAYSYKKLAEDVWRISSALIPHLTGQEQFIAISLGRNYQNLASLLAVLNVGAAFVPLDPDLPLQRREFILKDSGCSIILTDEIQSNQQNDIVSIDVNVALQQSLSAFHFQEFTSDRAAYIIYTSGSTGLPKAVVLSRRNLSVFVNGALEKYQIDYNDRILQFSSLSFDACIEEIFCSLSSGAGLYLRYNDMLDPNQLIRFSIENKISVWDLPTAYWRQLIENESYTMGLHQLSLRLVIIGGEAVYPADISLWQKSIPEHNLINTYGPTETTVVALCYSIESKPYKAIPIGVALSGYHILIVDKNNLPVPEGISGELLIFGDAVARTYLNRPEESEKVFIYRDLPGYGMQKCYKTGDIVFRDRDGLVYYLGRKDKQVKIRGFRVEIQEIEQQLLQTGIIKTCVVLVKEDEPGNKKLLAFCRGYYNEPDFNVVKEQLNDVLPSWMIPHDFFSVDEIPLNANGKVDQKFLLDYAAAYVRINTDSKEKPETETEKMLYGLWQKILGVDDFCINDDFFDIGGHSLKAVALMAELKKLTGSLIPLASLIQYATIRKFAHYLDSKAILNQWNCLVPIRTEGNKPPLFLVHGAGLNILLFQSLVKHLDPDRPIYAFQAAGLDGSKPLNDNIETMAEEYIGELLKIQQHGPYHVLGFSLGGFIAFEMGVKLKSKGHLTGFTGLIDSVTFMAGYTDSRIRKILINTWSVMIKPLYNVLLIIKEPAGFRRKLIRKKYKNLRLSVKYILSKSGIVKTTLLHRDVEQSSFLTDKVMMLMNDALKRYKIPKSEIEIDLFKAGKSSFYIYERENYGWEDFALKGVIKHIIPAEHSSLFAPPNDKLFAIITDKRLNEIESSINHK